MNEYSGWMLDLYEDETGVSFWLLCDDGQRVMLRMDFCVTFYAAGVAAHLRGAWRFLQDKVLQLTRETRRDLFSGVRDVMAIKLSGPAGLQDLFSQVAGQFPELDWYDADIPLSLRFAAQTGVALLGRCRLSCEGNRVREITPLDSPWDLEPEELPLRILELSLDVDPGLAVPRRLQVKYERACYWLDLEPQRSLEIALVSSLRKFDPDLILTDYGDTWLFQKLSINPNRDPAREVLRRKAHSYFSYGQVVFRGAQVHLFGRWHIDKRNAMLYGEYGLEGVLEQARVSGLGVQEMARKSPGAGITAMQMLTALRIGVLVPFVKQQAESPKTLEELIRADKGGMIYQPLVGLHEEVAQIDFASMYPSIMVNFNISPETGNQQANPAGLVPLSLRPLLEKRLALKRMVSALNPRDCRVKSLKSRSAALKWLLVVCFGYLGYKNARFGRIESHEAVTAWSRELLLQAKDISEDMGYTVLHMYVDCLFVQKSGCRLAGDFNILLDEIARQTGISISLDGVYRWVAFLPSKSDARIPVPNRYFGVFIDGEIKYRGIELRRHDTPPWVAGVQLAVLRCLAQGASLAEARKLVPAACAIVARAHKELRAGRVPMQELVVTQRLSRAVQDYKSPPPAARAGQLLQEQGHSIAPGQTIGFVYTLGRPGVWACGLGAFDARMVNVKRYSDLLDRAAASILDIFGSGEFADKRGLLLGFC